MKVDKIKSEELKHVFSVSVPSESLKQRWHGRMTEVAGQADIPGFRRGKVPVEVIQSRYGKELLHEIMEKIVSETLKDTFEKEQLRPVAQPQITDSNFNTEFSADKDMEFTFEVSVAPDITEIDYSGIEISVPQVSVGKEKIDEFLQNLAEQNRPNEAAPEGHKAANGDIVTIDFEGFIGDEAFEGGKGEDHRLELGSGTFIPGFEDSLVGVKKGDKTDIHVTFPKDYGSADLAGKEARFAVAVKAIDVYGKSQVNDKLAESVGLENLKALQTRAEEMLSKNFSERSDEVKKVYLLNELNARYDFPLPQVLVEAEFENLWQSIQHAKEHGHMEEEDKDKSDDELRSTYQAIAERRIKLALLVEDIAGKNKFEVSDTELSTEGLRRMQQMPPHMQQAYMQQIQANPQMLDELRMPLLEGKVIEHILEKTNVKTRKVSEEEFEKIEKQAFSSDNSTDDSKKAKSDKKPAAKKAEAKAKTGAKAKAKD